MPAIEYIEPLSDVFTYVAWEVDPRRVGPVFLESSMRSVVAHELTVISDSIAQLPGVGRVRALETTFIPPLRGAPSFDLVILARADRDLRPELLEAATSAGLPEPVLAVSAINAAKFGDTEEADGNILLNHFAGSATPAAAIDAWRSVSSWYAQVLHVDNSTLLQFDQPAPFLIMNYVRIPGRVPAFLAQQLARPSFYRNVSAVLGKVGIHPFPVFVRSIES